MAATLLTAMITRRGLRHTIERGGEVGHCDCFAASRELVEVSITIPEQINRLLDLRTNRMSWILGEFGTDRTIIVLQKDRRIAGAAKWWLRYRAAPLSIGLEGHVFFSSCPISRFTYYWQSTPSQEARDQILIA